MSRRTRIKSRKNQDHFGLGTSHHNQYASSTSYFPKSYSALGKDIKFPSTAVPFLSDGKLTFYGSLQNFEDKIFNLKPQQFNSIHTVNIGVKGKIQQNMSQFNNCVFAFSMIICCLSQIFNTSYYRDKFFVKYSFELNNYQKIIQILMRMPSIQTVMLTFQDNFLNKQKLKFVDENLSCLKLKCLTLRNLTYFIWPDEQLQIYKGKIDEFKKLKKSKIEFIFVWQNHNVSYNHKQCEQETQSIVTSLCDEL